MSEVSLTEVVDYGAAHLSLPKSALSVFQLAVSEETTNQQLVRAIQVDPGLAARLLQKVNTPAFSRGAEVTSLEVAVARLGREQLAQLAAVLATAEEVHRLDCDLYKSQSYARHSVNVGLIAGKIANRFDLQAESIFVAGLLHDLGKPIEFHMLGDQMIEVLDQSLFSDELDLAQAEQEVLGFNHSEVGAALAQQWNLPGIIIECIRYHHRPEAAVEHPEAVAAVALANAIEHMEMEDDFEDLEAFRAMAARTAHLLPVTLEEALVWRLEALESAQKLNG
ncbi:MAG: HDOD domain-containing protein [Pseudomonadota bacterium]